MGLYVEPQGDKAAWFESTGVQWHPGQGEPIHSNYLPVVLLKQGYIALGVAYNAKELQRFVTGRPDGHWKLMPKAVLRSLVPGANKMKEFK